MSSYEKWKIVIEILKIISWPFSLFGVLLLFRTNIVELFNRVAHVEGKIGSLSVSLKAAEELKQTVNQAVELEVAGKKEEAEKLIQDKVEAVSKVLGLTHSDIVYLKDLWDGKDLGRWGRVNLVNAGLVELDGNKLTDAGKIIVERFLKFK